MALQQMYQVCCLRKAPTSKCRRLCYGHGPQFCGILNQSLPLEQDRWIVANLNWYLAWNRTEIQPSLGLFLVQHTEKKIWRKFFHQVLLIPRFKDTNRLEFGRFGLSFQFCGCVTGWVTLPLCFVDPLVLYLLSFSPTSFTVFAWATITAKAVVICI